MKIRGLYRLYRSSRQIRSRFQQTAVILLYHRVNDLDNDPQLLAVSPNRFAEHLQIIERVSIPMSLSDFTRRLVTHELPDKVTVITFDDGYYDNYAYAQPLLAKHKIPATIFVTTGKVESSSEFYWDELEQILLKPNELPQIITLEIRGVVHSWNLGNVTKYDSFQANRFRNWSVIEPPPTVRHEIYHNLCNTLRALPQIERDQVLNRLRAICNLRITPRSSHRTMTSLELKELAGSHLVEIGAHTVTHPVLAALGENEQKQEILNSKRDLEALLGQPVKSFSYPFGGRTDYARATRDIVAQAGFSSSCSNFPEAVWSNTDCYQLPRFLVRNWDKKTFETNLVAMFRQ